MAPAKQKKAPKLPLTTRDKAAAEREKAAARENKLARNEASRKAKKKKHADRCFGVPPLWGCGACLLLGVLASFMASLMLIQNRITGFGVACCFDGICNIGCAAPSILAPCDGLCVCAARGRAFMFLFGPRKYCRGAVTNGPLRACAALTYWSLIAATLVLCFVPGVPFEALVLCLICMKVAWAINLAAACGCLGGKGASKEMVMGQREAKKSAIRYVVKRRF